MIRWDENDSKRGVFERYEILLVMQDDGTWDVLVWVRKTLVEKESGLPSKVDAHVEAEDLVARLQRNTKRIEARLYDEDEDEFEDE